MLVGQCKSRKFSRARSSYTIKQEIENTLPQSNTSTAKGRGENPAKLGSSLAGGGHGTADVMRDPVSPEESLGDENRYERNTTMEEPQEEI